MSWTKHDENTASYTDSYTKVLEVTIGARDYGISAYEITGKYDDKWPQRITSEYRIYIDDDDDPDKDKLDELIESFNDEDYDYVWDQLISFKTDNY